MQVSHIAMQIRHVRLCLAMVDTDVVHIGVKIARIRTQVAHILSLLGPRVVVPEVGPVRTNLPAVLVRLAHILSQIATVCVNVFHIAPNVTAIMPDIATVLEAVPVIVHCLWRLRSGCTRRYDHQRGCQTKRACAQHKRLLNLQSLVNFVLCTT
jgi:hypothetical protein